MKINTGQKLSKLKILVAIFNVYNYQLNTKIQGKNSKSCYQKSAFASETRKTASNPPPQACVDTNE